MSDYGHDFANSGDDASNQEPRASGQDVDALAIDEDFGRYPIHELRTNGQHTSNVYCVHKDLTLTNSQILFFKCDNESKDNYVALKTLYTSLRNVMCMNDCVSFADIVKVKQILILKTS